MGHAVFARIYARRAQQQAHLQEGHRRALLRGLTGRVLEVGCGNGLNFAHYPPEVEAVVAIEPEPYLRHRARQAEAAVPVTVLSGRAEDLSSGTSGPFDAVVFSLVLCSVKDPGMVLEETKKVLRPGGALRAYEHVVAEDRSLASWQHRTAPLWSIAAGGCRPDRDTEGALRARFTVSSVERFDFCPGPRIPLAIVSPHVLIKATRPSAGL